MHDEFGAAAQRRVGHRVHVPDDQVGRVAVLEQRVGAAVHPDEHRPVLADIGLERAQVLAVVVAADDDQHVLPVEVGADVGHPDAVEEQVALAAQVLHRVRREGLELGGQPGARGLHGDRDSRGVLLDALGDELLAAEQGPAVDADVLALAELAEDVLPDGVDERDPGVGEDAGPEVGIPARDRCRRVDDRGDVRPSPATPRIPGRGRRGR